MKDIIKIFSGVGIALIVLYALSWIVTVAIIKLITICFGLSFSWLIATGIWLVIIVLKSIFNVTVHK